MLGDDIVRRAPWTALPHAKFRWCFLSCESDPGVVLSGHDAISVPQTVWRM